MVCLSKNGKTKNCLLHRLIAEAFIPNLEKKLTVNHKDGNKKNNNVKNLEWASYSENIIHAIKTGLNQYKGLKKSVNQYDLNYNFIRKWESATEAAKNITKSKVSTSCSKIIMCCKGKIKTAYGYVWKYAN